MTKQSKDNQKLQKKLRLKAVEKPGGKRVIVAQPFPDELSAAKPLTQEPVQTAAAVESPAVEAVAAEPVAAAVEAAAAEPVAVAAETAVAESVAAVAETTVAEPAAVAAESPTAEPVAAVAEVVAAEPVAAAAEAVAAEPVAVAAEPVAVAAETAAAEPVTAVAEVVAAEPAAAVAEAVAAEPAAAAAEGPADELSAGEPVPGEKPFPVEHLFPDESKAPGGNPAAEKLGILLSLNVMEKLGFGKKQKKSEADPASEGEKTPGKGLLSTKVNPGDLKKSLLSLKNRKTALALSADAAVLEGPPVISAQPAFGKGNEAGVLPPSEKAKGLFGLASFGKADKGAKQKSEKKSRAKKKGKADLAVSQEPQVVYEPGGRPTSSQLEAELAREMKRARYNKTLRSTVGSLVVVAAIAILVATVFLPVLRIYGSSMSPTVNEGEIVFSLKGADFKRTDILAVYYGNKLLVKRCIAGPGQWVDIDEEGNVWVDDELLDEPYLIEKAYGDCTITLPYQVPEGRYFVMGDNRSISQDSRNATVGCIAEEQIVGKIIFRIWPLNNIGKV